MCYLILFRKSQILYYKLGQRASYPRDEAKRADLFAQSRDNVRQTRRSTQYAKDFRMSSRLCPTVGSLLQSASGRAGNEDKCS